MDEVDVLFVNREVREVRELLNFSETLLGVNRGLVLAGSETRQAFIINVESQWVDACDGDVYSEVKFKPVEKQGVLYVLAAHELLLTFWLGNL